MFKVPLTTVIFPGGMKTGARAGSLGGKLILRSYCFKHGCVLHHRLALLCIISVRLLGVRVFFNRRFRFSIYCPSICTQKPQEYNRPYSTFDSTRIKTEVASQCPRAEDEAACRAEQQRFTAQAVLKLIFLSLVRTQANSKFTSLALLYIHNTKNILFEA